MTHTPHATFPPTRTAALSSLQRFVPLAGRAYAAGRNFDHGPGHHRQVSTLSPYLRHRLITEEEVLQAVLGRHSPQAAEKFIQEVFWRTYWKGWLEMRPSIWASYRQGVRRALDQVNTQSGLRARWEDACLGQTGIACFDAWARELVETGYLHNHARMWFASIWIFTLRLPWELGADFFLRHLLDGDPASNTLSWRWVGGMQTQGKTYLARADNIAKYTEGRFHPLPGTLAQDAPALAAVPHPPRMDPPRRPPVDLTAPSILLVHEEDLSPAMLLEQGLRPVASVVLPASRALSPLCLSDNVHGFRQGALKDATTRWAARLGPVLETGDPAAIAVWMHEHGARQIVTPFAPVGPVRDTIDALRDLPVREVLRGYDVRAWPFATAGFFKFKDKIPHLLEALRTRSVA